MLTCVYLFFSLHQTVVKSMFTAGNRDAIDFRFIHLYLFYFFMCIYFILNALSIKIAFN